MSHNRELKNYPAVVENFGGEFGWTLRFKLNDYAVGVQVHVFKIRSLECDATRTPRYYAAEQPDGPGPVEDTTDIDKAEVDWDLFVRWDGHYQIRTAHHDVNVFGADELAELFALLKHIFWRCGDIMTEAGTDIFDLSFIKELR